MADVGGIAGDRLRSFIERIERLHEERSALAKDISEVFRETKGVGFDVKAMREVLRLRRMDRDDRDEFEAIVDVYLRAIGHRPDFGTADANMDTGAGVRAEAAE